MQSQNEPPKLSKNQQKKQKKKQDAEAADAEAPMVQQNSETNTEQKEEEEGETKPWEPSQTAEERALEYKKSQQDIYDAITNSFKDDELFLKSEPDFSEKEKELETKFKKDEEKKIDKQVKRDMNEWEDLHSGNPTLSTHDRGMTMLGDKLAKIMNDSVRKSLKKLSIAEEGRSECLFQTNEIEGNLTANIKKRNTLEIMCKAILEKNHQLYLKHELMLDEERAKRKELADGFQSRMGEVTKEITDLKEERQAEFAANQDIRQKIQDEVARYKKHEENYQKEMGEHQKKM